MKNWYIVQSHSSFENKVASLIKEEAGKAKISEKFEEIIVPTHDVTEVKRGKRIQRKKKYFPGYVLIKSEMDNNIYHMIKNIKRVSGFLGTKGMPVPVSDKEIEKILGQIKDGVAQPKSGIEYSVGEKVQVVDGPFASFSGMVEGIDEEKSRLKVSVSIFGRPKIETETFSLDFSSSISSTIPLNDANGPSITCTFSPTLYSIAVFG